MQDRRGDWENGVNENLVSLNAAQRVTDKIVQDLDIQYARIDKFLRGDAEEDVDGLIARLHALETRVNEMRAVIGALTNTVSGDHTGGKGHEQRINALEGKRGLSEKREGWFWHFVTTAVSGVILVLSYLILNWERVEDFTRIAWSHIHHAPIATQAPAKRKARKPKKKLPPIIVPEAGGESAGENVH